MSDMKSLKTIAQIWQDRFYDDIDTEVKDIVEQAILEERKNNRLAPLKFVVQYRQKGTIPWTPMAAFDNEEIAVRYSVSCSSEDCPWEYSIINLIPDPTQSA